MAKPRNKQQIAEHRGVIVQAQLLAEIQARRRTIQSPQVSSRVNCSTRTPKREVETNKRSICEGKQSRQTLAEIQLRSAIQDDSSERSHAWAITIEQADQASNPVLPGIKFENVPIKEKQDYGMSPRSAKTNIIYQELLGDFVSSELCHFSHRKHCTCARVPKGNSLESTVEMQRKILDGIKAKSDAEKASEFLAYKLQVLAYE
eukprot:CAMPEP_0116019084 /NCGR_PEP_ID=MMETSP0321-20121206/9022_1 /TAXON_ID=163516 /ORGANISM="Leptocylindrus danicus var. danicus, Strain B650" /LENGTH=203 /DNA_ID=CAMNT_0003489579 /DNA_START=30 /DNA_END=641 /DNA_ORIENTATION=-